MFEEEVGARASVVKRDLQVINGETKKSKVESRTLLKRKVEQMKPMNKEKK